MTVMPVASRPWNGRPSTNDTAAGPRKACGTRTSGPSNVFHGTVAAIRLGGEALENRWNRAAVRHYRAAAPSRLVKDLPLYTL